MPAGAACGDPSDTDCDNPDACDGLGRCAENWEPDGTPCDDGDECTENDECSEGSCAGTLIPGCRTANRVSIDKKGSLLVYSKVEIKWGSAGNVVQDTFVTITNDYPGDVFVHWYFVHGDKPLDAVYAGDPPVLIERAHPGWNWVDHHVRLTYNEPAYFSVLTGLPAGMPPFTVLDPGTPPGRPDDLEGPDQGRVLRGYVVAYAVDSFNREISWNHLSGSATIVSYAHRAAWEYNAWAFQAMASMGQPTDSACPAGACVPGELRLDGIEYDLCFDRLLLDFFTVGSQAMSGGGRPVMLDTDLTLLPMLIDVRQDSLGPARTKAHFDIWNQNEDGFSGTTRCISCWDQTLLSRYELPNHFMMSVIHTDKGKARIDGMEDDMCDAGPCHGDLQSAPWCSQDAPLLGVSAKVLAFSGGSIARAYAGKTLVGQGTEAGWILADTVEMPDTLVIPSAGDELLSPAPLNPVSDWVKRGR